MCIYVYLYTHIYLYIYIYIYIVNIIIIIIIIISMVRFDYELFVYKDRSPLMILRQSGKQILCQKIVKCGGVH